MDKPIQCPGYTRRGISSWSTTVYRLKKPREEIEVLTYHGRRRLTDAENFSIVAPERGTESRGGYGDEKLADGVFGDAVVAWNIQDGNKRHLKLKLCSRSRVMWSLFKVGPAKSLLYCTSKGIPRSQRLIALDIHLIDYLAASLH